MLFSDVVGTDVLAHLTSVQTAVQLPRLVREVPTVFAETSIDERNTFERIDAEPLRMDGVGGDRPVALQIIIEKLRTLVTRLPRIPSAVRDLELVVAAGSIHCSTCSTNAPKTSHHGQEESRLP